MRTALCAAISLLAISHAFAGDAELAQRNGCIACHQGVAKKIGPSFKTVAEKYLDRADAETLLAKHIVEGTGPDGAGWAAAGEASLPFMPPNGNVSEADAHKLAKWILTVRDEITTGAAFVSERLEIGGAVEHPLSLSIEDLKALPSQELGNLPMVCQSGAKVGQIEHLKGVPLRTLLEKAAVVSRSHNDVKKMAVNASATDGYKVVFSWSELFNSPIGDGVIVFFERDGQPLGNDEGRIALISSKDIRTPARVT